MAIESGSLKDSQKRIVYECPFCHIVYHSKEENIEKHQKTVHAMEDPDLLDPEDFVQQNDESDGEPEISHVDESTTQLQVITN